MATEKQKIEPKRDEVQIGARLKPARTPEGIHMRELAETVRSPGSQDS